MAEFEAEEGVIFVGNGAKLTGVLRAQESVVIDGVVEGEIISKSLTVGPSGVVNGQIDVSEADISGEVAGSITAKHLLKVRSSARVTGNWLCGEILVERGAVLNGIAGDEKLRASSDMAPEDLRSSSRASTADFAERGGTVAALAPRPIKRALGAKLNALGRK